MNKPDDCPNTARLLDWMGHCKQQHDSIDRKHTEILSMLNKISDALHGNGREGVISRVARNSQRIDAVDTHVKDLRVDVDKRFDLLTKNMGALNVRFWKMAILVGAIVVALNKIVPDIGVIRGLGL